MLTAERTGRRPAPKKKAARPGTKAASGRARPARPPARAARHGGRPHRAARRRAGRTARPATRTERRKTVQARRARVLIGGALTVSVLALVAWFPASALLHQHQQLSSESALLNQLRRQDRALQSERAALASPAEVGRIARQQYQLVAPGSRAFAVLPPNGGGSPTSPYPGDPGFQPPVAPSDAQLPAGSDGGAGTSTGTGAAPTSTSSPSARPASVPPGGRAPSLVNRILQTLEFWR